MGYSNDYDSGAMESNSISLAMFASVGFHAVLFVLMAFFPAASETVKKPLRIVNLLPPRQSSANSLQPQAKTSTLEDILQNPLPDLSAGFPPVGNADASAIEAAPDTSSYLGGNSSYNNRVDTSNLTTTNSPKPSFPPSSPQSDTSANQSKTKNLPPQTPSQITPAPTNSPTGPSSPSRSTKTLPEPPKLIGAAPLPTGLNTLPPLFPDNDPENLNPPSDKPQPIPPSKQNIISIISENVPYQYPASACPDALQGTATLTYYRKPDGMYSDGSINFENQSDSQILNEAATNAVINSLGRATGNHQKYVSRFEFKHSEKVCSGVSAATPPAVEPITPPQMETPSSTAGSKSGDASQPTPPNAAPSTPPEATPGEAVTPTPSKSEANEDSKQPTPDSEAPEGIPTKTNDDHSNTVRPAPKPELSPPTPPSPKDSTNPNPNPINPSPDGISKPAIPSPSATPSPAAPPSPLPESSVTPEGSAVDLIPVQPVTPQPQPQPPSIKPSELKLLPDEN